MIKFVLLFLCVFLATASNVKKETEPARFGIRRLLKTNSSFSGEGTDGVLSSRRHLERFTVTYKRIRGYDRPYGNIGSCGRFSSHQQIKDACTRDTRCVGYTYDGPKPWCLKTSSSGSLVPKKWFEYFEKIGNTVIEHASGVGGWGGSCTCPDGKVYQVGDNYNACGSLACVGGTSGTCNRGYGSWSNRKVICAGVNERVSVGGAGSWANKYKVANQGGSRFESRVEQEWSTHGCQGIVTKDGHPTLVQNADEGLYERAEITCSNWDYWTGNCNTDESKMYCYKHKCNRGTVSVCVRGPDDRENKCYCTKAMRKWQVRRNLHASASITNSKWNENTVTESTTVGWSVEGSAGLEYSGMSSGLSGGYNHQSTYEITKTAGQSTDMTTTFCNGVEKGTVWQYWEIFFDPYCDNPDTNEKCEKARFSLPSWFTCTKGHALVPCCEPGHNLDDTKKRAFCSGGFKNFVKLGQCFQYDNRVTTDELEDKTQQECTHEHYDGVKKAPETTHSEGYYDWLENCSGQGSNAAYYSVYNLEHRSMAFNDETALGSNYNRIKQFVVDRGTDGAMCRYMQYYNHVAIAVSRYFPTKLSGGKICYVYFGDDTSFDNLRWDFQHLLKNYQYEMPLDCNFTPKDQFTRRHRPWKYSDFMFISYNYMYGNRCGNRRNLEETDAIEFAHCKCDKECSFWNDCCEKCANYIKGHKGMFAVDADHYEELAEMRKSMTQMDYEFASQQYMDAVKEKERVEDEQADKDREAAEQEISEESSLGSARR